MPGKERLREGSAGGRLERSTRERAERNRAAHTNNAAESDEGTRRTGSCAVGGEALEFRVREAAKIRNNGGCSRSEKHGGAVGLRDADTRHTG